MCVCHHWVNIFLYIHISIYSLPTNTHFGAVFSFFNGGSTSGKHYTNKENKLNKHYSRAVTQSYHFYCVIFIYPIVSYLSNMNRLLSRKKATCSTVVCVDDIRGTELQEVKTRRNCEVKKSKKNKEMRLLAEYHRTSSVKNVFFPFFRNRSLGSF
jgi:hypothetical protein